MKYVMLLLLLPQLVWATEVKFKSGTVGNEEIHTTTISVGDYEFTSGTVGDREIHTTTINLDKVEFTNGTLGNEPINVTTIKTNRDDDDDEN